MNRVKMSVEFINRRTKHLCGLLSYFCYILLTLVCFLLPGWEIFHVLPEKENFRL